MLLLIVSATLVLVFTVAQLTTATLSTTTRAKARAHKVGCSYCLSECSCMQQRHFSMYRLTRTPGQEGRREGQEGRSRSHGSRRRRRYVGLDETCLLLLLLLLSVVVVVVAFASDLL
jgi:hypothetical protein